MQASELEQCRSVLFATMHVKHLVLLTKAFVYPLEEHNPPPPPESPPSPPPSPPSSRSLLSLYDRKTIVTTVLAELDQQHKTLLSQKVEGEEGEEEEEAARMKESRYEKAALLVRARKQLKNWQCYLRAVAELEGSVASGEYR